MPSRKLLSFALMLLVFAGPCRRRTFAEPLTVSGPASSPAYKIVTLTPKGGPEGAAYVWDIAPEDKADVVELADGRALVVGPPGTYRVKLRAITSKDGKTAAETARASLVIEGSVPKPPDQPPGGKPQSMVPQCIGRLRVGNSGCTATPIWPRRADGRWDVLTASHCTGGPGTKGTLTLKDGRELPMTVTARQTGPDVTWFVTDQADLGDLPFGVLATAEPPVGTAVWQAGYGTNQPTIRKDGTLTGSDANGQLSFRLSVSHGDSGGPIFRSDTNEILACVCCTREIGARADMWGGSWKSAAAIRPGSTLLPVPDLDVPKEHGGCHHPVDTLGLFLPGLDERRRRHAA